MSISNNEWIQRQIKRRKLFLPSDLVSPPLTFPLDPFFFFTYTLAINKTILFQTRPLKSILLSVVFIKTLRSLKDNYV